MTSSSDRRPERGFLNVPPPEGTKPASPYTRFIPREELGPVQAWLNPSSAASNRQRAGVAADPSGQAALEQRV